MDVYVENTENGLQIANTVARDGENKTPALSFLNTYRRQDASLTVTKHTSGSGDHDLADKTRTLILQLPCTGQQQMTIHLIPVRSAMMTVYTELWNRNNCNSII